MVGESGNLDLMTWVKICGITNLEDALEVVDAGADALGFVFYEKSPRNIDPEAARGIVSKLPRKVERVGVFVSGCDDHIPNIIEQVGLTGIQLHLDMSLSGDHMPPGLKSSDIKQYLALPVRYFFDKRGRFDSFTMSRHDETTKWASAFFLDSGTSQVPGGTGRTFDWRKAVPIAEAIKRSGSNLVVAGGLTPDNVGEAIRILEPWGVDVSSGVEAKPGKKDPGKVRDFVAAVRQAETIV